MLQKCFEDVKKRLSLNRAQVLNNDNHLTFLQSLLSQQLVTLALADRSVEEPRRANKVLASLQSLSQDLNFLQTIYFSSSILASEQLMYFGAALPPHMNSIFIQVQT